MLGFPRHSPVRGGVRRYRAVFTRRSPGEAASYQTANCSKRRIGIDWKHVCYPADQRGLVISARLLHFTSSCKIGLYLNLQSWPDVPSNQSYGRFLACSLYGVPDTGSLGIPLTNMCYEEEGFTDTAWCLPIRRRMGSP